MADNETLRLADAVDPLTRKGIDNLTCAAAAAELRRLAAVEAERDALREILNHIPQVEAELAETSDKLHAMTVERDALLAALRQIVEQHGQWNNGIWAANIARDAIALVKKGGGNG